MATSINQISPQASSTQCLPSPPSLPPLPPHRGGRVERDAEGHTPLHPLPPPTQWGEGGERCCRTHSPPPTPSLPSPPPYPSQECKQTQRTACQWPGKNCMVAKHHMACHFLLASLPVTQLHSFTTQYRHHGEGRSIPDIHTQDCWCREVCCGQRWEISSSISSHSSDRAAGHSLHPVHCTLY